MKANEAYRQETGEEQFIEIGGQWVSSPFYVAWLVEKFETAEKRIFPARKKREVE
jgi:hypothetical protein